MKYLNSILFVIIFSKVSAQDTHYQTNQFGTRSALMGGAVVGGVKDNTAIFYNPGSLGFIDTGMVSINANLYRIETIQIENVLGQTKDFKGMNFTSLPLLISGMIKTKNDRLKIGYGFATPVNFSFSGSARLDGDYPITNDIESPGLESYIAQGLLNTELRETLIGLGFGYKLNDNWSVGLTNQFTYRSHNYTRVNLHRFYLNTPGTPLVSSNNWQSVQYFNLRYSAKLGLAYTSKKWDLGITLNTPAIGLFGSGAVSVDVVGNNLLINGQRRDLLANDQQEKLKSRFKSPLRLGGGVNFKGARSVLGLSAEYAGSVAIYDVLRAEPSSFIRPPELAPELGSEDFLRVKSAAKSVLNIALGYEYKLSPDFSLMASFRTDNSFYNPELIKERGIKPEITTWDIYHFTGGAMIKKGRSTISLGLLVGTGVDNNRLQQGGGGLIPTESDYLQGTTTITTAKYFSIGGLLGFSFSFLNF